MQELREVDLPVIIAVKDSEDAGDKERLSGLMTEGLIEGSVCVVKVAGLRLAIKRHPTCCRGVGRSGWGLAQE